MVHDLMNYARSAGIPVGPGRGSSAGSLVAWCVGITNVDPIRHGLLFERFINPERLDLPDADLDFSQARRHEVIEYLGERYGEDYVAGIPNFTYLGAASALRDTARIFGVDSADMAVSKDLRFVDDDSLSLEDMREELSSLDKYAAKYRTLSGGHQTAKSHARIRPPRSWHDRSRCETDGTYTGRATRGCACNRF
jgi:DNA polymerase-3 subunit alpha